ncbi:hypothetical protein AVEN_193188-1 [Araneus ventricosus]|uniref:ribonuclease H n=1 Tax=Araneus ventricosus TaxID=182803 RepID=A0A4Y2B073_ARAVE|nr:hypothetical protein AVEN_193188-1 [Araneus ventricosus]
MAFIERQLQLAVNKIHQWSAFNGLTFSTAKTSCVHFCRKRRLHPEPEIKLEGQLINVVSEVKFLGVIFDKNSPFIPIVQVVPTIKYHLTPWNSHGLNFLNPFETFDKANTASEIYQQLFADNREAYQNFIPIFTDGSKCSSCTSFACVFITSTLSFQLHPSCSIFTAEITAILHALSQISSGPPDNYNIYSDSLSALKSMTSLNRFSHPLTFNILELHDRLTTKDFTILFCWIPSHVSISGNELADNLARSATNSLNSPVPVNDVKKYAKSILHSKWQAQWDHKNTNKLQSIKRLIDC